MNKQPGHLENLSEIRSLMERSTRFISLSGLAGVFAGTFAIAGVIAAYLYLGISISEPDYLKYSIDSTGAINRDFYIFFSVSAMLILCASLAAGSILTIRNARKKGQRAWDNTTKRVLINMLIPLVAGGIFCFIMLYHQLPGLIAPVTLIFYGVALLNASKYTFDDIRYLGIGEIIIGLIASVYIGYGLLFWAFGFGLLHIIYGIMMYKKYEA